MPANEHEEVLLVLLVGEAMAVRDAVLSQAPEFGAARDHALHNAVALVDLLALAATRWGQLCLVLEVGYGSTDPSYRAARSLPIQIIGPIRNKIVFSIQYIHSSLSSMHFLDLPINICIP